MATRKQVNLQCNKIRVHMCSYIRITEFDKNTLNGLSCFANFRKFCGIYKRVIILEIIYHLDDKSSEFNSK